MLKLSKRCKSLVVLLLLCGCLVSFSSVSFADVVSVQPSYTTVSSTNYFKNSSGQNVVTVSARATSVNSTISYAGSDPTLGTMYNYETHSLIHVEVTNTSNRYISTSRYVTFSFSFNGLTTSDNNMTSWDDTKLIDYSVDIADGLALQSYNNGSFFIKGDSSHRNGVSWWLAPYESVSLTLDVTTGGIVGMNPSGETYPDWHTVLMSAGAINTIGITGYTNAITYLNSAPVGSSYTTGDSYIDESIQSQTQQQQEQHQAQMEQSQQQHQEQMEQSQQQYEDLTDPGSTEGEEFITGTDNAIKDKIGIFTFIDTLLENMLGLFVPPEGDPILTFPGFSIEIAGETHQIWTDHSFNLASLDEDFSALLTAVRFGTVAVVYFALINFLGDTYLRIFAGGKEDD